MIGKEIRLERIINRNTRRTVIIPMDHGVSSGPIRGLLDLRTSIGEVAKGGANAIVIHKGLVGSGHRGKGKDIGLVIHLSASTSLSPDPNAKMLVFMSILGPMMRRQCSGISVWFPSPVCGGGYHFWLWFILGGRILRMNMD